MIFITFKRITKTGFVNFWRNGFLSFAAVVVITLSLSAFGTLIFGSAFGRSLITNVKDKVDINVYFALQSSESDILALKAEVDKLPEVASTTYISRDQALSLFREKWQNNSLIMQGLDEIGDNPFPASLNIKAEDPGQYASISQYLTSNNPTDASGVAVIEKINYAENKLVIDRLSKIIPTIEQAGAITAVILIFVAVIIVFNTIRLIVYTSRDEIAVMKLVGASNVFIRGPMVVSGIMYGIVSGLITLVLMAVFSYWSDAVILRLAGVDVASNFELVVNVLSRYFTDNFVQIFFIIMGAGIILGGLSSYIAARKYLKV